MNRMEYCSVDVNAKKAHRTCRMDEQVYVRDAYVQAWNRTKDNDAPNVCWIAFPGWASDYSKEVVFDAADKKPDLKYQKWINHGQVEDIDIKLQLCWAQQLADRNDEDVDLVEPVTVTDFDEVAGDAFNSDGQLVMIESRMDRVFSAKEITDLPVDGSAGSYHTAMHNYSHNPTHAMRKAYAKHGG